MMFLAGSFFPLESMPEYLQAIAKLMSVPALLYVGLMCTSVPTILWATGLRSLSLTTSATVLLSESAFAVILGALVMNEPLGSLTLVGAALVFAAIFLAVKINGPKNKEEKEGV